MSVSFELIAEKRSDAGKGASRRLRHSGLVPGIIYGAEKEPEMITVPHNELVAHLEHEAFYSHILSVKVGDEAQKVVLKDLQRHPAKPFILHFDLLRISDKTKIRMHVPLHFTGEEECPAVKAGGSVSHHVSDVEVDCYPKDLPEFIEVDMSAMNAGDSVYLSTLKLPEGVSIHVLTQGADHDALIVSAH